ncbi:MAG TPA: PEGA domain-containing protein [Acidobacteriota bacterium]|nr:PEGA domain-containing protein [Acidobacteriota bacterium]
MKKDIFQLYIFLIVAVVGIVAIFSIVYTGSPTTPTANADIIGQAYQSSAAGLFSTQAFEDGEYEYALDQTKEIMSLKISGDVNLKKENGQVTIVLVDTNNNEYLIHEGYVLLNGNRYTLSDDCDETCILPPLYPQKIMVLATNAKVTITSIATNVDTQTSVGNVHIKALELKEQKDAAKIEKLNARIAEKGLRWIADETPISELSYRERKARIMGSDMGSAKYGSMMGLEFYSGGVFDYPTETGTSVAAAGSTFPPTYDWRNVHGENWMSPVSDQGYCGSCWDFAATGHAEAYANVYFNQHLDLDLSEQDGLSSSGGGSCAGGWPAPVLQYYATTGAIPESCFPYTAIDANGCNAGSCGYPPQTSNMKCADWSTKTVKFPQYKSLDYSSPANVQKSIISKGPLNMCQSWGTGGHCIVYMGYSVDAAGTITWIFQNSWGSGWGESGYGYMTNPPWWSAEELTGPIVMAAGTPPVACVDKDSDGFCNWGVGSKPNTCSTSCAAEKDCDDSTASITTGTCNIPTTGAIAVTSNPSGAAITLDGAAAGTSPKTFNGSVEGTHTVDLNLAGYCKFSTAVNVIVGQTAQVNTELYPPTTVTVNSVPSGASVYFDNIYQGVGPVTVNNICPGSHQVKLTLNGYMDYTTTVNVQGQPISISPSLTGAGALTVTSTVGGAKVYVDGVLAGNAPVTIPKVAVGSHQVRVSAKSYTDYSTTVTVSQGQTTTVSATLTKQGGKGGRK